MNQENTPMNQEDTSINQEVVALDTMSYSLSQLEVSPQDKVPENTLTEDETQRLLKEANEQIHLDNGELAIHGSFKDEKTGIEQHTVSLLNQFPLVGDIYRDCLLGDFMRINSISYPIGNNCTSENINVNFTPVMMTENGLIDSTDTKIFYKSLYQFNEPFLSNGEWFARFTRRDCVPSNPL